MAVAEAAEIGEMQQKASGAASSATTTDDEACSEVATEASMPEEEQASGARRLLQGVYSAVAFCRAKEDAAPLPYTGPWARELVKARQAEARRRREHRRKLLQTCTCRECTFEALEAGTKCPGRACPICLTVPKCKRHVASYKGSGSCEGHGICWHCVRRWVDVKVMDEGTSIVRCPGAGCSHILQKQELQHMLVSSGGPKASKEGRDGKAVWERYETLRALEESGATRLLEVLLKAEAEQEQRELLKGCQACPHCLRLVERSVGCHSMVCRCGKNFCYECGAPDLSQSCVCSKFNDVRTPEVPTLGLYLALRDCSLEDVQQRHADAKERLAEACLADVIAGPLLLEAEARAEKLEQQRAEEQQRLAAAHEQQLAAEQQQPEGKAESAPVKKRRSHRKQAAASGSAEPPPPQQEAAAALAKKRRNKGKKAAASSSAEPSPPQQAAAAALAKKRSNRKGKKGKKAAASGSAEPSPPQQAAASSSAEPSLPTLQQAEKVSRRRRTFEAVAQRKALQSAEPPQQPAFQPDERDERSRQQRMGRLGPRLRQIWVPRQLPTSEH